MGSGNDVYILRADGCLRVQKCPAFRIVFLFLWMVVVMVAMVMMVKTVNLMMKVKVSDCHGSNPCVY